jgi:hypothetical protein
MRSTVADDIIDGLIAVTKQWTKQRKREEREASAHASRIGRLRRDQRETQTKVAFEIMPAAYAHASNGGAHPVTATQIMYASRDEIQERTGKQLDRQYFNQTLLPNFISQNPELTADWDVAYDDRGHFTEPHTGLTIGLGTWSVRSYLDKIHDLKMKEVAFAPADIVTCGPHGEYGAVLYTEKEGFQPLFEQVQLNKRFDIALMSNKGISVTASRALVDAVCHAYGIPLLILRDFDKAGFSLVASFKRRNARRLASKTKSR